MAARLFKRRRRFEKRRTGVAILLGLIVTVCLALLYSFNALNQFELTCSDAMMRLKGPLPASPEVVIIEIGPATIETIQKWPIPRNVYARLIKILSDAGAHSIGFNIMFPEQSNPADDKELAEAIHSAGNVFLSRYFDMIPGTSIYRRPVDNLPLFQEAAKGVGHINMDDDRDGVLRKAQLFIPYEDKPYRQLAFLMACDWWNADPAYATYASAQNLELTTGRGEKISIPLDRRNEMTINWSGAWRKSFRHYSLADVLKSADQMRRGERPVVPLSEIKGRICLVGLTAPGAYDAIRTPFERLAPGVAVHAGIISQLLRRSFLSSVSWRINLLIIVILGVAAGVVFPRLKPAIGIISMLGICAGYAVFAAALYFHSRIEVALASPLLTVVLAYIAISIHHEIVISTERARLHHLATRDGLTGLFVIGHFRLLLDAEIAEAQQRARPLSLIMADIDYFKRFNDTYGHPEGDFILKEVAGIINSACRELDLVGRYGGEEFIVMLPNAGLKEALPIAERIRKAVEAHPFSHGGREYKVVLSLGVAQLDQLDSAGDLVKRADEALYEAKRGGKNRVCGKTAPERAGKVIKLE